MSVHRWFSTPPHERWFSISLCEGGFPHLNMQGGFPHLNMQGGFPHYEHLGWISITISIHVRVLHTHVCSYRHLTVRLSRHPHLS